MLKKKIVLIGPVYPYKGGISHYTGLMYRALAKTYDVYMLSYKMQYPKILFKKEQCDYDNDELKIDGTNFLINTANPFNWFATANNIKKMKPDLVIIQWWHPYFAPCYWTICKLLRKTMVLFVCHNVFPHERFPMDRFLTKSVLRQGNFFVVHSISDEMDLCSIKSNAIYQKTALPSFNTFKLSDMTKEHSRKMLKLDENQKVLLFFGFVREYKGLKHLLRAVPCIKRNLDGIKLLIVGDFGDKKEEYLNLISEMQIEDDIDIYDGYIPDKEVEKFFCACDVVVLPYESATQSGVIQVAYDFDKPVIATNVGGLPEVVINDKTGYVVEAKNSEQLAEAIIKFFQENKAEEFSMAIREEAYKYSWDRMVAVIEKMWETR